MCLYSQTNFSHIHCCAFFCCNIYKPNSYRIQICRDIYIYIVNVTLTSARCDTVFHIRRWRRWSSDRCRGRLGSVFISFDVGAIDVDGLTWRQVDTSNLRFNCVDGFALLSNIYTYYIYIYNVMWRFCFAK